MKSTVEMVWIWVDLSEMEWDLYVSQLAVLPQFPPKSPNKNCLVVSTPLKNISQNGKLPQVGVKIKKIWNHLENCASYQVSKKSVRKESNSVMNMNKRRPFQKLVSWSFWCGGKKTLDIWKFSCGSGFLDMGAIFKQVSHTQMTIGWQSPL